MDTDQQMRAVLLELMMLMHGSTQSWNPTTTGTRDRNPQPPGEPHPIAEDYRNLYAAANGDLAKRRVLKDAKDDLDQWRGHSTIRHAGETQAAQDARMVSEGEGWTVHEVARAFSCTKTRVRKACAQHNVGIDYQDRLCAVDAVSRASMAQAMRQSGSTQQDIAIALGIHQSNVSRLLKTSTVRQAA